MQTIGCPADALLKGSLNSERRPSSFSAVVAALLPEEQELFAQVLFPMYPMDSSKILVHFSAFLICVAGVMHVSNCSYCTQIVKARQTKLCILNELLQHLRK